MPQLRLSLPIFAPHCIVGSCEVMSSQTHGKQDRGPLFLYFLPQSVRGSLSSLDFPGVSIPREEGSVRSQKVGFLPLLSFFLGYFSPKLNSLKQHSFCGSVTQAQVSQMPPAQGPLQGYTVKVAAGASVISRFVSGRICICVHSHGCWQPQALPGCEPEASLPCHAGLSIGQLTARHLASLHG